MLTVSNLENISLCRQGGLIVWLAAFLLLTPTNVCCGGRPQISEEVQNITVALGRDAMLKCYVKHLADYKVAWIHIDRQMILTIGRNVITRIPRFTIVHDNHHTWSLHIKDVQAEDRGYYMCQVNTDPMISVTGHLDVVVPPSIVDEESSPSEVSVREKHNTSLICRANGVPQPHITWRREDGKSIFRDTEKSHAGVSLYQGEYLDIQDISREQMGAYLCIASNKIPPSVSKRIKLVVEFAPMMYIPNQLIGAPLGTEIQLQCETEASPKAITYWVFNGQMILRDARHDTEEEMENYRLVSRLTVFNISKEDIGIYKCVSKNSLGETESTVRLYEVEAPSTSTELSYYEPHLPAIGKSELVNTREKDVSQRRTSLNSRQKWRTTERSVSVTSPTSDKVWWNPDISGAERSTVSGSIFLLLLKFKL
ncbi:neurotrimin isoform X2 [Eurytemora carolleeae]|uniref:neurotrimin isoform X2 n=1 Tax=Eurytemora carolleeae TaxID=1294199 RepID=UPI000C767E76|nr:neurotrimin isoform X2 [Eurytemora carolleeae]|eukprot:XP_023333898.1 neurotrimin-like isoform X2 [Eurytemora affinis]